MYSNSDPSHRAEDGRKGSSGPAASRGGFASVDLTENSGKERGTTRRAARENEYFERQPYLFVRRLCACNFNATLPLIKKLIIFSIQPKPDLVSIRSRSFLSSSRRTKRPCKIRFLVLSLEISLNFALIF